MGGGNVDGSVTEAVTTAIGIVRESGIPNHTDSMFTTLEGEWDECMAVIKACCDALAEVAPRVELVLKADIRPGFTGELIGEVANTRVTLSAGKTRAQLGVVPAGPRVDVVALYAGADAAALDACAAAGARAVVLEALGSGNAPAARRSM